MRINLSARVCSAEHGGPNNAATVYGHYADLRNRTCMRLPGTDTWVYDLKEKKR